MTQQIKFRNLTPHDIVIYDAYKSQILRTIPAEKDENGKPIFIRVNQEFTDKDPIDGIPVALTRYTDVAGLPDPEPGVYLIVSILVVQAMAGKRHDLLSPDTGGGAVRDDKGQIIGTTRFLTVCPALK